MAATSITKSWDALATTTLEKFSKRLTDNIFVGVPVLNWLLAKGRVKMVDGGRALVEHLMFEANSTARAFVGYDPIDLTPQEGLTIAQFEPREYDVSINISRRERNQNRGESQLIDLLRAKTKQAEMSIKDLFATDIFAAQAGDKLDGLGTLVSDAAATVGLVAESTNSWWAPQRDTADSTSAANFIVKLNNIYNDCTRGSMDVPDLIATTQTIQEAYVGELNEIARWQLTSGGDNSKLGFGFNAVAFRAKPLIWDLKCPASHVYLLNSEHLRLQVYSGSNFDVGPMITPHDQHASSSSVYFMGNMTTDERRKQGVMTNISTLT